MIARFDLDAIREGRSDDPELLGDDVVVVDYVHRRESRSSASSRSTPILTAWFLYSND